MKQSDELNKLAPALSKAQAQMAGAKKDSNNPFFKSKYADLTSVWRACKDALHDNGLSVIQSPISIEKRLGVSTMLLHDSGQWISDEFTLGVKKENDPQADGSSITYARRYALAAFVGVCPEDNDAEGAMNRTPAKKPPMSKQAAGAWTKEQLAGVVKEFKTLGEFTDFLAKECENIDKDLDDPSAFWTWFEEMKSEFKI